MADTPAWLPVLMWPAGGAAIGLVLGGTLDAAGVNLRFPAGAGGVLIGLIVIGLVAVAGVGGARVALRARAAANERRAAAAAARAKADAERAAPPKLLVKLAFPDIPETAPDVWGVGDAMTVRATVTRSGRPVTNARVVVRYVSGDSGRELARATVGPDGAVDAPFLVAEAGTVNVEAQATDDEGAGTATRELRVVRYADEVQALFNDFRQWANRSVPSCEDALTAREVADVIGSSAGKDVERALQEVARIYELVAYGERHSGRDHYLGLLGAFGDMEAGGLFEKYRAEGEEA